MIKTRNNIKDSYERVYLMDNRLSVSMTPESVKFIRSPEIQKLVKYSANISYRKHPNFKVAGIELEDLVSVSFCFAMIFNHHYNKGFQNKKHMTTSLCRFIGQKLYEYKIKTEKKMRDVPYLVHFSEGSIDSDYPNNGNSVDVLDFYNFHTDSQESESFSEEESEDTKLGIILAARKNPDTYKKLKRIAGKYVPLSSEDVITLSLDRMRTYECQKLAFEIVLEIEKRV